MKKFILVLCCFGLVISAAAQNQFNIANVLPSAAKQTQSTSSGSKGSFIMIEQIGELPNEKTKGCTPASANGTVGVRVEFYGTLVKFMFDQIIQSKRIEKDQEVYTDGYKERKTQLAGNAMNTVSELTKKEVDGGTQLSYIITTKCDDGDPFSSVEMAYYYVQGTTIVSLVMSYYGSQENAEKYRKETVENVKKLGLESM